MIFDEDKELVSLQRKALQLILILLWMLLIYVVFKLGGYLKEILNALAIAMLINYLLSGPVAFLTKYIKFRVVSVISIYLSFVLAIGLIVYYLLPTLSGQLGALQKSVPLLICEIDNLLFNFNLFLKTNYQIELPIQSLNQTDLIHRIFALTTNIDLNDIKAATTSILSGSLFVFLYAVLTIVISFYLLVDGKRAWELFLIPFSGKLSKHLNAVKVKIDDSLHAFIAGQFQIASLTSIVMLITYLSLGVPYSVVFGIVHLLEIIPLIGTWAAIVPCILITFVTSGSSKATIAFVVYIIYTQFVRDNFVAPRIMGNALGFHPIGIIVAVILGAKLGGAMGVVFALPVLAIITSVIDYNIELAKLKITNTDNKSLGA